MHMLTYVLVNVNDVRKAVGKNASDDDKRNAAKDMAASALPRDAYDWFVIGGRWTGYLTMIKAKANKNAMNMLTNVDPFNPPIDKRDVYRCEGYDDDVMLIDHVIYEYLKNDAKTDDDFSGGVIFFNDGRDYIDEDIIGNYYIVVVDRHI